MEQINNSNFIQNIIDKSLIYNNNQYSTFNHIAFITKKKVKHKKVAIYKE